MKKIIALILSVLCLFSVFSVPATADFVDDLSSVFSSDEEEGGLDIYCIVYKKETLSDVKVIYFPNPSVSFDGPGYVPVTNDTPIAINHDFVCWKDQAGTLYYAGDPFLVTGECALYPVWEEKKDNDPYVMRIIKAALSTFVRMFQKMLGIFEVVDQANKDYYATMSSTSIDYDDED